MGLGFRTFEKKGLQFRQEFAGVEPIPRCNSISYAGDNTSPSQNRFWPMLDNHDWISLIVQNGVVSGPHLDYFTLNGNERYYDLRQGALHFFMIDSDQREPDGITAASIQGQ